MKKIKNKGGIVLFLPLAKLYSILIIYLDKSRAIKGLVVCFVLWLGSIINGMGLLARCMVPCCGQDGYQVQVPATFHRFIQININNIFVMLSHGRKVIPDFLIKFFVMLPIN